MGSNSPSTRVSTRVSGNPLNDSINQWLRMWPPLGAFAPQTDTETTTTTVTGDNNHITLVTEEMETKSPSLEEDIVTNISSYGKQLGRISDALNVLISLVVSQMDASDLKQEERHTFEAFFELYKKIAEVKGEHIPPDETQLDLLFRDIQDLKGRDHETYENLLNKLRDFADTESRG